MEDVGWHSRAICRKGVISFKYIGHDATVELSRMFSGRIGGYMAGYQRHRLGIKKHIQFLYGL